LPPYTFRLYERNRHSALREVRPYLPENAFTVTVPEDRAAECRAEYIVVVKGSMWPDHEFQKQLSLQLPECSQ
jgi:hypothetical protein